MKLSIEYCTQWNYFARASSLEAELKSKFEGIETNLILGRGGVFEIMLNGDLIFSKKEKGRFPDDGEIVSLIEKKIKPSPS